MIINTGSRTDIPAYFSGWFYNRIHEGFCMVRNPYFPMQVTRYSLNPTVVDALAFCTKNPQPMLNRLSELTAYKTCWFVTITPYGQEIEPYVPEKERIIASFQQLAEIVGVQAMSWRYDPIFISEKYNVEFHIQSFERMARLLKGYTKQCVVSFVDLYEKTKRNFPSVKEVTKAQQETLIDAMAKIAADNHMKLHLCCENQALVRDNVDADGCMSQLVIERAIGCSLKVPKKQQARKECNCLLGADIGMYNTCGHGCLYCYANFNQETVAQNRELHDPKSPFLIGKESVEDIVNEAKQISWQDGQMNFLDML